MGYTHDWIIHPDRCSPEQFFQLAHDTKLILNRAKSQGIELVWEYDEPGLPPEVDGGIIRFNGLGDEGYETFLLDFRSTGNFCKTARKPYDSPVCAVLIRAHEIMGDGFELSSDGDWDEDAEGRYLTWAEGRAFYTAVFGREPENPLDDEPV